MLSNFGSQLSYVDAKLLDETCICNWQRTGGRNKPHSGMVRISTNILTLSFLDNA